MNISKAVIWLSWLIRCAGAGRCWHRLVVPGWRRSILLYDAVSRTNCTGVGKGVYGYETLRSGVGFKGQDVALLLLGVPLLVLSSLLYRRGSIKGELLLTGALAYFLYTYGSMALGAAYNPLFLVYVTLFSASLFALILAFTSIDLQALPAHFSAHLPRGSIAVFLFAIGLSLLVVWLGLICSRLATGSGATGGDELHDPGYTRGEFGNHSPVAILRGVLLLRAPARWVCTSSTMLVFSSVLGSCPCRPRKCWPVCSRSAKYSGSFSRSFS